jgi:hypothetical protein
MIPNELNPFRPLTVALFTIFTAIFAHPGEAGHIYFSDRGASKIYRSDFHGNNVEELFDGDAIPGSNRLRGIVADPERGFVYFCDSTAGKVFRGNLETKKVDEIVGAQNFPADIAIDQKSGKIYWCEKDRDIIHRANLDGSDVENLVSTESPYFLQLDLESGKIYFGDFSAGHVFRANIADGSDVETLVSGISGRVRGVHLDLAAGMLYWANRNDGKIQRRPLDGAASEIEDLYTNLSTPHGMMLDIPARKIYWADTGTNGGGGKKIQRGDMNGSGDIETLFTGSQPWDVYIDATPDAYSDWSTRFFRKDAPPEIAGPKGDPDRDTLVNEVERALGSHPLNVEPQSVPSPSLIIADGNVFPALTFERQRGGIPSLNYKVELSTDLRLWNSGDALTIQSPPADVLNQPDRESITVQALAPLDGSSPTHFRLRLD